MVLPAGNYDVQISAASLSGNLTDSALASLLVYDPGNYPVSAHHQGAKATHSGTGTVAQGEPFEATASVSASTEATTVSVRDFEANLSATAEPISTLLEDYAFGADLALNAAATFQSRKVVDFEVAPLSATVATEVVNPESYKVPTLVMDPDADGFELGGSRDGTVTFIQATLYQGSWHRLVFSINSSGEPLGEIGGALLALYNKNTRKAGLTVDDGSLQFSAGQLVAILDESITGRMEGAHGFELWIKDVFDNPMFVTKGRIYFIPTKARF